MSDPMPEIKSKHSLVAKYVTAPLWEKLSGVVTKVWGYGYQGFRSCGPGLVTGIRHC